MLNRARVGANADYRTQNLIMKDYENQRTDVDITRIPRTFSILNSTLQRIELMLRSQYEVAGTIRHKGERGRQREHGLNRLLIDVLPKAYGIATGEIIPFKGEIPSPQCDIIIYDRLQTPILGRADAVQQIPLEGVYSVIEVKSVIDSKALKDAASKFSDIRKMPRCPTKTRRKKSAQPAPFFALFGYHLESSVNTCRRWVKKNAINEDVIIVSLDGGMSWWMSPGHPDPIWIYNYVWETRVETYEVLSCFIGYLLETITQIDLGKPHFLHLFTGS